MYDGQAAPPDAIRSELAKILGSSYFVNAGRLAAFLRYIVETTLDGKADQIKEYPIGIEVFEKPESFDPRTDTIVRTQASKLRSKLAEYYASDGRDDPVRIELTRGSYVPAFRTAEAAPASRRAIRPRAALVVAAVCVVVAAGVLLLVLIGKTTQKPASIAVLPFVDLSPGKDQEHFCDGMTEEITSALAKVGGLRVVSATSAFVFKGKRVDVREIARQLNVSTVLEGSVRKDGDRIRVAAQLANARDGYHLWTETYDRELGDIFRVQDEISRAIAQALQLSLVGEQPARRVKPQTSNLEAYNVYLLGRHHWYKRTEEGLHKAVAYFEQAVKLDPGYARAFAGLADAYVQLDGWEYMRPHEAMPKAKDYAKKALSIDPDLAEAYVSLGAIYETYDWDSEATGRAYERAVALDPGYATAHWWYSCWLVTVGRTEEGRRERERTLTLDPLSVPVLNDYAEHHIESDELQNAIALSQKAMELDPGNLIVHRVRAKALESLGKRQEAVAALEQAVSLAPEHPPSLADLATMRARMGQVADARRILERLHAMAQRRYVPAFVIAQVYAALGDDRSAVEWLATARRERSPRLGW